MAQAVEIDTLPGPRREDIRLETVLQALGDPVRMTIVRTLYAEPGGQRPCGTFGLPVAKSTASHHFRVLREAGVIHQHAAGRERLTELRTDDLEARFPGLLQSVTGAN
ncbi:MAG TPA: helix-turn-helix domain-containing protein [Thermoleophilaceae bacterium]|jgi:DNA-binding transcriptional ArsR family regulator|nr:helix-turn-helix domain-containing protein [Thermoleophilaceae bacterium]